MQARRPIIQSDCFCLSKLPPILLLILRATNLILSMRKYVDTDDIDSVTRRRQ